MIKIVAVDARGKRRQLEVQQLALELPQGQRLIVLGAEDAGGLRVQAHSDSGTPVLTIQPSADNEVFLRVAVCPDPDPLPAQLALEVQRALTGDDKLLARPRKPQIRAWAQAALEREAVVTVRLVGAKEGRELNRDFRGKDYATNVLTFVYDEGATPGAGEAPLAGDLVLCVPVVVREALDQGKSPEAHYAHLVVHGMLHLQGYDHEIEADAQRMEARERQILASLGFADPYA
ncbi:MAG: rRNA maturation RNase YbeY [Zoogloeaceae bacterium]|nr:rRNA maturation RNase YbeY [Zoogloeaceae bacterium]